MPRRFPGTGCHNNVSRPGLTLGRAHADNSVLFFDKTRSYFSEVDSAAGLFQKHLIESLTLNLKTIAFLKDRAMGFGGPPDRCVSFHDGEVIYFQSKMPEKSDRSGGKRLADAMAGKGRAFPNLNFESEPSEKSRRYRSGGARADDDHVEHARL